MVSVVGFIPARAGSQRIPGKNIRPLRGHPLLAWSIAGAREAAVFDEIVVVTDSPEYAALAKRYDANVFYRSMESSLDDSPDFLWVEEALRILPSFDVFAILRPTCPVRRGLFIRQAVGRLVSDDHETYDSLRAVALCREHPAKMWRVWEQSVRGHRELLMNPYTVLSASVYNQPSHSVPTQTLPLVYAQTAALEVAWANVVIRHENISGNRIGAVLTPRYYVDLNTEEDWILMEALLDRGLVSLPEISALGEARDAATTTREAP